MEINGLGFAYRSLYLTPQFLDSRPTERLIGEGIRSEHLNDDTLGRALDSLYDHGVTELFWDLAAHGATQLGLAPRFAHLDATSFLAHGEYNSERETEDGVVHVRKGYSRDHRPDLNQVVLNLMVEHKAGLPMLMEPLSGNASDQGSFPELIDQHLGHLQNAHGFDYVVARSSLYSSSHVEDLGRNGVKFITRVPLVISQAQEVVQNTDPAALEPLTEGYETREHVSEYGNARQRWLVVYSEAAEARAKESAANRRDREHKEEKREFRGLLPREFSCREDVEKALSALERGINGSVLTERQVLRDVCFTMDEKKAPVETGEESYLLQGKIVPSEARKAELVKRKSFFILAMGELDEERLWAGATEGI
jgi:transposase